MSAPDPRALLDALDEAHAKATPGPWSVDEDGDVIAATDPYSYLSTGMGAADAAAIVAEHNALPALTAAVRAALALADELEQVAAEPAARTGVSVADFLRAWRDDAPDRIRATVTAALTGGQQT